MPKVTANKPDEKAKCIVWTAVSWVTLSDQTGETGTCLLRLQVGDADAARKTQGRIQRRHCSGCRLEIPPRCSVVLGRAGLLHNSLGSCPAMIPPSGGTLQEGEAESWWVPSAIISVLGLSSVLAVKATSLCLHCGECSLLCSAAEMHVLLLLEVMT